MRPVRDAVGMVRDAPELDSLSAHELARRIVEHFVGIDVAVVVRSGHRLGIEIVWPRTERADHEAVTLERLMYGRGLVHAADDRLEVIDVEGPGIEVAIPTDDIERVVVEDELVEAVVLLHEQTEVSHLVVGLQLEGTTNVALGVGCALLQLAELVPI